MIKSIIINRYLAKEFLHVVLNMSFAFFCLGFILNLFEEINFFKDFDVGFSVPIVMTSLFVPGLLYKMFPFVILFSGIWFFRKIKKTDEIVALKISGISNFSIIIIPSFIVILLGIFFITLVNPITSTLIKKYESVKGSYEKEQDYLAAINVNGIWIKEKNLNKNFIIRSSNLDNEKIMNLPIYEFDINNNFIKRIEAKSADISTIHWALSDATIIDNEGIILEKNINHLSYQSMYDLQKIKSLYSNLDTVSFWSLDEEIKLLEDRGYSTREMRAKIFAA